ncbi:MAG: hypothetical protein IPL35_05745 [Sphingobacteriales bacterium]|nr:hypothetical protein [Sphingobacteriales bacterium]
MAPNKSLAYRFNAVAHSTRFCLLMPGVNRSFVAVEKDLLRIYANAERHYRQPTLNDLFWQPG